jgi:hypothetical protein
VSGTTQIAVAYGCEACNGLKSAIISALWRDSWDGR